MAMANSNRVYEDIDPPSDLVQEQGCDTILLNLPGFRKEQLRVQLTTSRILKVSGERPVGGNKWRRFHKEFSVSQNCDTKLITAKFENGILYIRQPKLITPAPPQAQQDGAEQTSKPPAPRMQPQLFQLPQQQPQPQQQSQLPQPQPQLPQLPPFQPPTPRDLHKEEEEDAKETREKEETWSRKDEESKEKCVSSAAKLLTQGAAGSGLFKELKKPANLKRLVVSVLMVLIVGFYISHMFKSFTRQEQQIQLKCDQDL